MTGRVAWLAGVAASAVGDVSLCHQTHSATGWLFPPYCSVAAAAHKFSVRYLFANASHQTSFSIE